MVESKVVRTCQELKNPECDCTVFLQDGIVQLWTQYLSQFLPSASQKMIQIMGWLHFHPKMASRRRVHSHDGTLCFLKIVESRMEKDCWIEFSNPRRSWRWCSLVLEVGSKEKMVRTDPQNILSTEYGGVQAVMGMFSGSGETLYFPWTVQSGCKSMTAPHVFPLWRWCDPGMK